MSLIKNNQISELEAEIERLTHLHNLDHSLADQWQKKNEVLQAQVEGYKRTIEARNISGEKVVKLLNENKAQGEKLRERLIYILSGGWRTVYIGSRLNQLKITVADETKEWLEQGRITIPHSEGQQAEQL